MDLSPSALSITIEVSYLAQCSWLRMLQNCIHSLSLGWKNHVTVEDDPCPHPNPVGFNLEERKIHSKKLIIQKG